MVQHHDNEYIGLVEEILESGKSKDDRTGTGTFGVFGKQLRFNLENGSIPLLTTKKMHVRSIIIEILWYLKGTNSVEYLRENGVRIWNEWATEEGDVGPLYGPMWRRWPAVGEEIDQLQIAIDTIRTNPASRRIIVSAWNPEYLPDESQSPQVNALLGKQALAPCHAFFQFYVQGDELSCQLYQRSADTFLGVPFNIAQYSILTHMIAQITGLKAKEFIWTGGDVHIYNNHVDQCKEQVSRDPYPSPVLHINERINTQSEIDDFTYEDFEIVDYVSHPTITGKVSI